MEVTRMINADLSHVTSLEDFYSEIRKQQEEAHGSDYCEQHDAIVNYMMDCSSYKELGTHQGGTAACAMLQKPKFIELVDNDMSRYRKFLRPLAEKYCKDNKIELSVKEVDSTSLASLGWTVDMLLIDSYHRWFHMEKELKTHHMFVRKYMIMHDTASVPDLAAGIDRWCRDNPSWKVVERSQNNCGYTVIKKDS